MKRLIATILALICTLSLLTGAAIAVSQESNEEQVETTVEQYLSAAAKNMWLYESNDLSKGTVEELALNPSVMSSISTITGVQEEEVSAYVDDINFLQEKTEYFKEIRQAQNIQRNDFTLAYKFEPLQIESNHASVFAIENISFHYPDFPEILSELTNYYTVELIKHGGTWFIISVDAENDDFDALYKGTGFTAENAKEIMAAQEELFLSEEKDIVEALMQEHNFTESNAQPLASGESWYKYNPKNASAYAYTYVSQMFGTKDWEKISNSEKAKGRAYYNANFNNWGADGVDCQNFASQCIWTGFNGSNSLNQIYNATTGEYSPIMDRGGSYKWYGTIPNRGSSSESWISCNGAPDVTGFRKYIAGEEGTGDPDMIVKHGTVSGSAGFSSVYKELEGALMHVRNGGHAIIVTDVKGPSRSQILFCAHTADRKALALSEFYSSGTIYYFIPQQMKIRNAPEVNISATLPRPLATGSSVSVGGTTDVTCNSLKLTVTSPQGTSTTTSSSGKSIKRTITLNQTGLYIITITAQKNSSSSPVNYVYTVRAY